MEGQVAVSNLFFFLAVGTLTLLLLAGFMVLFFYRYQQRLLRHQQEKEALQVQHHQQVLDAVLEAQEQERARIARDLHDEIGAMLSSTKLFISQCAREHMHPGQAGLIKDINQRMDEAIQNVRRISGNLLPVTLEMFGLSAALEVLCRSVAASADLEVRYEGEEGSTRLTQRDELLLYRIVQELLSNSLRHAAPSRIEVRLRQEPARLQLHYQDNGRGFDYEQVTQLPITRRGLGLVNLKTRVSSLQGKLQLTSGIGKGTTVDIEVPLMLPA